MVTMGVFPFQGKNAHGRAGDRTRDLMVSSQELWPPSHEAGHEIVRNLFWRTLRYARIIFQVVQYKGEQVSIG